MEVVQRTGARDDLPGAVRLSDAQGEVGHHDQKGGFSKADEERQTSDRDECWPMTVEQGPVGRTERWLSGRFRSV